MSNHTSHRRGKGSTKLIVHGEDEISSEYLSVRDTKLRPLIPTMMGDDVVSWSHHDATPISKPHQKCVRFGRVEVREYPIELGSSIPTCGAPLGIAWSSVSQCSMTVDDYEKKHPDRSGGSTLVLPSQQRLDVLVRQGVNIEDIQSSIATCDRIRKSRVSTANRNLRWDLLQRVFVVTDGNKNTIGAKLIDHAPDSWKTT